MNFSVVITTYNRPDFLEVSLESVLNQTVEALEITIIDDNSSVDYREILGKFSDDRIRYIKQPVSGGANVARNLGVKKSMGDVVAFLDDDDAWLPDYLSHHMEKYREGAQAVVSGFKHLGNESKVRVNSDVNVTKGSLVKGNTYCGMSGFSCKRDLLIDMPFDTKLNNGQDWDMFVRLFNKGIQFKNIQKPVFLYRFQNLDGIGTKLRKMTPDDIDKRIGSARKHKEFLGDFWFKQRIAEQLLASLKYKNKKYRWLRKSIKMIGVRATLTFFIRNVHRKLSN